MSLVYKTSKWAQHLWQNHTEHSRAAHVILSAGTRKQPTFPRFADDVHAHLYLKHPPDQHAEATVHAWATDLLTQAEDLPQWHTLKQRCALNGFAAGLATESVLQSILAQV